MKAFSFRTPALLLAGLIAPGLGAGAWASDLATLDQRMTRMEAQLQNQGLIGLLNQINALKSEVARLRGSNEEQAYQITQMEQRQKVLFADLDARIKELSGQLTNLRTDMKAELAASRARTQSADAVRLQPAKSLGMTMEPAFEPGSEEDAKVYDSALSKFKAGEYQGAVSAFQTFYGKFPNSQLAPNALYWMGLAFAVQGEHTKAAAAYERLIDQHAGSPKVPDAMLSLARAHLQLGDPAAARKQLDALVSKYPTSNSAESARKLLATLE